EKSRPRADSCFGSSPESEHQTQAESSPLSPMNSSAVSRLDRQHRLEPRTEASLKLVSGQSSAAASQQSQRLQSVSSQTIVAARFEMDSHDRLPNTPSGHRFPKDQNGECLEAAEPEAIESRPQTACPVTAIANASGVTAQSTTFRVSDNAENVSSRHYAVDKIQKTDGFVAKGRADAATNKPKSGVGKDGSDSCSVDSYSSSNNARSLQSAASMQLQDRIEEDNDFYAKTQVVTGTDNSSSSQRSMPLLSLGKPDNNKDQGGLAHSTGPELEKNYAEIIGTYYSDYLHMVDDSKGVPLSTTALANGLQKQSRHVGDNDSHSISGPAVFSSRSNPTTLRSAYNGESAIDEQKHGALLEQHENPRNSYSRMLENALFYSQAIEQIRENDTLSASNPYAAAVPRARPGKDDIRQRRARNVIASREVFSIITPSTYIPLRSDQPLPIFDKNILPPMGGPHLTGPRAMRSEPTFKSAAPARRVAGNGKSNMHEPVNGGTGSSAVPLIRILPKQGTVAYSAERNASAPFPETALANNNNSIVLSNVSEDQKDPWEAARRAGIDQPLASSANHDEGIKQRREIQSPHTVSSAALTITTASSVVPSQNGDSRSRSHSIAESGALGSDDEANQGHGKQSVRAVPPHSSSGSRNRLSAASQLSSVAGSAHSSLQNAVSNLQRYRRNHLHHNHHSNNLTLTAQSKKVAMRLLMRAGLSRVAIRVARMGPAINDAPIFENGEAMTSNMFDAEAGLNGLDLDPNGLQGLKAARRKQVKNVDEFGFMHFEGDEDKDMEHAQQYEAWLARNPKKATHPRLEMHPDSEDKWETFLAAFNSTMLRSSRKIKQLVQAGMPPRMRARIYYALSGASSMEVPGEYTRLLALERVPIYDVIERDVSRCYPDHVLFTDADGQGQRQLRRILRAYAQYNPDIGYCQGMGRLVGLFLIIGLSEERAFWMLTAVIKNYIPKYYESDLGGLRVHTSVFESLLRERNPKLHAHLSEQGCDALMYATPWFMTVFTLSLPWESALRIWDWFIYRGTKVLFRVALAITDLANDYLMTACPTIAEQLGFLLHIPPSLVRADTLIAAAIRVKLSERHIERLTQAATVSAVSTPKN
ncbi:hypothetical protein IWW45_004808, partial [Coemansia sp. RSA 485]